ncbi:twin-arginine translocase subunit TatC [Shigella flexneri]
MIVIFLCLVYFANDIYHLVSAPSISSCRQGSTMIATTWPPAAPPIKLTFMVLLILSAPVILYQVWASLPGASTNVAWRRCLFPARCRFIGMAFAYFVVFPPTFGFCRQYSPKG